ncbi:MAG: ABC transporter permease [candidate division Zixibacteria bacterium]|nr:ABC transporter permease [candidate division Zixibacteria bacterium]
MITFKVAFRNVLRQKRRTLLTMLTMLGGFTLAAISIAWSDGTYNVIIDMFTRAQLGHIQIHGAGYLDRPTLYNTVDDYAGVGERIGSIEGVVGWSPRLYSAGLASVGEKSAGVRIIGIDPVREIRTTRFDRKIISGRSFAQSGSLEAILGKGLAKALKADVGSEVVLVSQGADGSIANDLYEIVGIIDAGDVTSNQTALYLTLGDAQELLVLHGRVHEIVIIAEDLDDVAPLTATIEETIDRPELTVEPWQEFAKSFYNAMKADQRGIWIMVFIIVLLVSVGVLNTVLMTVLERTREYGVLRAMGVRPLQVIRLVVYEVTVMAVVSVVVGTLLSLVINYLLSLHGVPMPTSFTYGGMEFSRMYTEINARSFIIPAVTVVLSAIAVSVFPAIRAARTAPARAMRTH